jgi:GTP-binding protein EngB required for normal cell division
MHLLKATQKEFQIIFTKADKIGSVSNFESAMRLHLQNLGFDNNIIVTSTRKGLGAKEVQLCMLRAI